MIGTKSFFKFAVLTDTHIRAPLGDQSSPYPVNDKANNRARYAVSLLQAQDYDFAVHLGDMVHPLPHMDAYSPAAEEAHSIFSPLKPDLYFVPGNHDSGDKVSAVSPAGAADANSLATYKKAFGKGNYSYEHKGILFVVMNSSLVNSNTNEETTQNDWLIETLTKAKGKRIFLFSHYPPFICHHDEADHYDNYANPGRQRLLDLAVDTGVEAIISGHVHQFFLNEYRGVRLYCLPATSFSRQDFSTLFRGPPADEFGRDDAAKFGVTLFHVDHENHWFEWIPTGGKGITLDDELTPNHTDTYLQIPQLIPSLRHHWYQATALPANGPMEEFSRKLARNDYPILRAVQLGIKVLRVPLSDLVSLEGAQRMGLLNRFGIKFLVFCEETKILDAQQNVALEFIALLNQHRALIHAIEIVSLNVATADISQLSAVDCPIWMSQITTSADQTDKSKPFAHTVTTGAMPHKMPEIAAALTNSWRHHDVALVVQCPFSEDAEPVEINTIINQWLGHFSAKFKLVINVKFALANPADENINREQIAGLISKVAQLSAQHTDIGFILDTYESFDRGYHPRLGLIDTLSNIHHWYPRN